MTVYNCINLGSGVDLCTFAGECIVDDGGDMDERAELRVIGGFIPVS